MKLEIILGAIVLAVFLGGSIFFVVSEKRIPPEDTLSADAIIDVTDVKQESTTVTGPSGALRDVSDVKHESILRKMAKFPLAPEISTPDGFINTGGKPITIAEFKGKKVVLLDI